MSSKAVNYIKLAFGIASAVAVEILAKGNWAHAVWVPVALMFATDFQKVFAGDEVRQLLTSQRVRFLLGTGAAVGVELLARGPWANAVWVPVVAMLFTNMEQVFTPAASPSAAAVAAKAELTAEAKSTEETVTPNERPPVK